MESIPLNLAFRPAVSPDDRTFVVSTWSSSFKASSYAGILWTDDYAQTMHRQINRVLDRPETVAMLACDGEDPNFLFGHIVAEVEPHDTPIVHYTFVKAPYRRNGIARKLFEAIDVNPWNYFVFTCRTAILNEATDEYEDIKRVLGSKMPRARFDPNGIRYSKANRRRAL